MSILKTSDVHRLGCAGFGQTHDPVQSNLNELGWVYFLKKIVIPNPNQPFQKQIGLGWVNGSIN